jgi:hypothetical protein
MFDRVDGGIPTLFLDGPKKGQVGVVTPSAHGQPPESLVFIDGQLLYLRRGKAKMTATDPISGGRRRVKGVTYEMDPQCRIAHEVRAIEAAEAARRERAAHG